MEKERYMLIHVDKYVYRFKWLTQAQRYALIHCRDSFGYYIIVDTVEDKVVYKWMY